MDIENLHAKIECVVLDSLHWQDLFQTKVGILNEPISAEELKKIRDIGRIRYRHDALFHQRVESFTFNIIEEIKKAINDVIR